MRNFTPKIIKENLWILFYLMDQNLFSKRIIVYMMTSHWEFKKLEVLYYGL